MFKWLRQRKINKLLIVRSGLLAWRRADSECGEVDSFIYSHIAEIEERLRQLGWKEKDNG